MNKSQKSFIVKVMLVVLSGATVVVLAMMFMPPISRGYPPSHKTACITNLSEIGSAMLTYRDKNGEMPPSLAKLRKTTIDSSKVFVCPATDKTETVKGLKTGYKYVGPLSEKVPPMVIIAYDRENNHGDGRNCLFRDFHAEFVPDEGLQSGQGFTSLEQSYEEVLKAYDRNLTAKQKEHLKDFYEIE